MDKEQEWMKRISMHDYAVVGNDVYFTALNYNGLFKMSLPDRKISFVGIIPNEGLNRKHLYGAIVELNGKLYMPPMHGDEVAIFDLKTKQFEKYELKYEAKGVASKFYGAITYKDKVFLIPARYPYLVEIDVKTNEVTYIDKWRELLDVPSGFTELYVKNGYFIKDDTLYMASMVNNTLIKISLKTYETEIVKIGINEDGFMDMCQDVDGENIWFVHRTIKEILRWNEVTGEYEEYSDFPEGYEKKEFPFINVICNEEKVCAIAYQSNMSIEIDKQTGKISEAKWDVDPSETDFNEWKAKHYFARKIEDGNYLIANIDDNSFYVTDGKELKELFYLKYEHRKEYFMFSSNSVQKERQQYTLSDYLKYVISGA